MNYELTCEGFPPDDELREQLLMCGRKFLMDNEGNYKVTMSVKQTDGFVEGRIDLNLKARRISALVQRKDPISAMQAAIQALEDVLR